MSVVNKALATFFLGLGLILPLAVVGATVQKSPPPLPESVLAAAGGAALQLLGYGRMRWWFWDAFDASLWISGDSWSWNEPFVLELRYVRDFNGNEIVEGTRDQWEHLGFANSTQHQDWLRQLTDVFPTVKAGDQLAGIYLPSRETRFFLNGEPVGVMQDPEFGRAFFSIWLDAKSSQPVLRDELLGNRCVKPATIARAKVKPCSGDTMPGPTTRRPGAGQS